MIKNYQIEEIRKLIEAGFNLELISFELDIPLEELENINISDKVVFKENKQICSRIEQMKQKYTALSSNNKSKIAQSKQLSNQDIEVINSNISDIQSAINSLNPNTKKENETAYNIILKSIKELSIYPLTVEQSETLISLLNSEELNRVHVTKSTLQDNLRLKLTNAKSIAANKLLTSIDDVQCQLDDINELKNLRRKITLEIEKMHYLASNSIKNKISDKILRIQQANSIAKIKVITSPSIIGIISTLSDGTIDIPSAKSIIAEEARKAVESNSKSKFPLTEVQEKDRISLQIREKIVNDINSYDIKNPELLVSQLQELCDIPLSESLSTVIDSLISRKNFKTASALFDKFYYNEESTVSQTIKPLKFKIINAEIGNIVSRMLNSNEEAIEQIDAFKLLEKKINSKEINLKTIYLGKSQDGLRNITLADIWENELQNQI